MKMLFNLYRYPANISKIKHAKISLHNFFIKRLLSLIFVCTIAHHLAIAQTSIESSLKKSSNQAKPKLPPGTSQGKLLWLADLSKGDVLAAGFKSTPWNVQYDRGELGKTDIISWPPPIVDALGGVRAIKFTLPDKGERIEVEPNHRRFASGEDAWFGFAFYLAPDFHLNAKSWHVIYQLHGASGTASPPISLEAENGGSYLDGGYGRLGATPAAKYAYHQRLMALDKGQWHNVVYDAAFNDSINSGDVDVWVNGVERIKGFVPPSGTADPLGPDYLKCGLYHDPKIPEGTIYQRGYAIGTG